jgi:GNAT superfamily N-acetyltransferase
MIRRVTLDDVETYRDVRLRALADSPSSFGSTLQAESDRPHDQWVERVVRSARGDARTIFLAFDADDCVGLVGAVEDDLGADRQLVSMWVAPTHRGTGVAVELVEAVLTWARDAGARRIGLWVTRGNDRAQRFYERMGFTVTGDVQPLPSDPCKEEIRMIRQVCARTASTSRSAAL